VARKGLILDRDGTLTEERGYVLARADLRPIALARPVLARARAAGWVPVVVTNQSAVGRGLLGAEELDAMHADLKDELGLVAIYHCPHRPDEGCRCRKPRPGLVERAITDLDLDPSSSVMIGDNLSDVQAAIAAGVRPVLVLTGHGQRDLDGARRLGATIVDDLAGAIDHLLAVGHA